MKLEDEALSGVNGGVALKSQENGNYISTSEKDCPVCNKKTTYYVYSGGRAICSKCGHKIDNA